MTLTLSGGLDSFNLLLPKGQCIGPDQYQMYKDLRGDQHAIPLSRLESIHAHGSNQTCSEYGVNSDFDILAELYDNEELIFLANTGVLSKPMTRDNWQEESSFQPFAHNIMQHEFFAGDPYNVELGTGVFGRMLGKSLLNLPCTNQKIITNFLNITSYNLRYTKGTARLSDSSICSQWRRGNANR